MATDFDFDGSFNDDPEEGEVAVEEEEIEEEEEESGGGNRLRTIILLLFLIVLLCLACFILPGYLGFSSPLDNLFGGSPAAPANPPATEETTEPVPATDEAVADQPTDESTSGEETAPEGEATTEPAPEATDETQPEATEEAGSEPDDSEPGDDEMVSEHDEELAEGEPTTEPEGEATTEPEPTVAATLESCDNNGDPTAMVAIDPDPAMMGKGQAIVTLDGRGSSDDGAIVEYGWDFGDGSDPVIGTEAKVTHAYKAEGSYIITLTVLDDCAATASTTAEVTVVGPTPSADDDDDDGEATATPTATSEAAANVTIGSCYKVQRGDTLTGIASSFGVSLHDLARVNNVTTQYFVLADQGMFIPDGPIKPGPNGYEVQTSDTLNSIAFQCGVTLSHLAQVNGLNYDAALTAGQVIIVPIGYR